MCYTVHYTIASFSTEVPWSQCDPKWADVSSCYVRGSNSNTSNNNLTIQGNNTVATHRVTASLQYWEYVCFLPSVCFIKFLQAKRVAQIGRDREHRTGEMGSRSVFTVLLAYRRPLLGERNQNFWESKF